MYYFTGLENISIRFCVVGNDFYLNLLIIVKILMGPPLDESLLTIPSFQVNKKKRINNI